MAGGDLERTAASTAGGNSDCKQERRSACVLPTHLEPRTPAWPPMGIRIEDVRARKLTIANGRGVVHGRAYDLAADYGIDLRPYEVWS